MPLTPGSTLTETQQLVKVYTLNEDMHWENQGAAHVSYVVRLKGRHVFVSQGLTKFGLLEKGIANHISILALRTP